MIHYCPHHDTPPFHRAYKNVSHLLLYTHTHTLQTILFIETTLDIATCTMKTTHSASFLCVAYVFLSPSPPPHPLQSVKQKYAHLRTQATKLMPGCGVIRLGLLAQCKAELPTIVQRRVRFYTRNLPERIVGKINKYRSVGRQP